ncbi:MAG TPA: hypothetical protein IGS53_06705 [Leptolyngbyaceae cyanobacterium M33_DOE_097]|nr:hypothetical protein [Leptolyngbyaceae cyanobacterium M33_DOE_097]
MAVILSTVPRYRRGQVVRFVGGKGTIQSYRPEGDSWSYWVEMEMGPEPEMGRIGAETTIVLAQAELELHNDPCLEASLIYA